MSLRAMNIAAANTVSHSARSSKAASYALIEAVRFFAYRFFIITFTARQIFLPHRAHMAKRLWHNSSF